MAKIVVACGSGVASSEATASRIKDFLKLITSKAFRLMRRISNSYRKFCITMTSMYGLQSRINNWRIWPKKTTSLL